MNNYVKIKKKTIILITIQHIFTQYGFNYKIIREYFFVFISITAFYVINSYLIYLKKFFSIVTDVKKRVGDFFYICDYQRGHRQSHQIPVI